MARISEQCNDWLIVIAKLINVFADVEKRREESLSIVQAPNRACKAYANSEPYVK